nr:release factor glutamine methyltransferase [Quercus suber]
MEDAIEDHTVFSQMGIENNQTNVRLGTGIEELYNLWKKRIEERRPFQYLVGCKHWRDLVLSVQDGVLIPRPETELIVDLVADVVSNNEGLREDVEGKLASIVSNPPYIPSDNIPGLQAEVGRHEPRLALDGGLNGMDELLHLCNGAALMLRLGGFFIFEVMDTSQIILLEDELNDCIADQQEEAQIEPTHGSPKNSNTPSRHSKEIVEVPEIVLEDEFIDVLQGDSIHRIKTKPIVGHPKRRLKSALEKKNGKSRSKTTHAEKHASGLRKKACEARQVESLGSLNKVSTTTSDVIQEEHHFGKK